MLSLTLNKINLLYDNNDIFEMILFMQIRVHPVQRYSSRQERKHWHANLIGHDRMLLTANGGRLKSCTKQHIAVAAIGDLLLSHFFYYTLDYVERYCWIQLATLSQNIF